MWNKLIKKVYIQIILKPLVMISYSVHLKIKANPSFTPCLEKIEISISLWLYTPGTGTGKW